METATREKNYTSVVDFATNASLRNAVDRVLQSQTNSHDSQNSALTTGVDSEVARLRLLKDSRILESGSDNTLDVLTESLRLKLDVTWVAVCLVDLNQVYVKAAAEKSGFPFGVKGGDTTSRRDHFANVSVANGKPYDVINDTLEDERVKNGSWVTESPHVRFFAGVPLLSSDRQRLGCLCVLDNKPHAMGMSTSEVADIQKAATLISSTYIHNQGAAGANNIQRKRRSMSKSDLIQEDELLSSSPSICRSPSPKRQDRSRSSSPVPQRWPVVRQEQLPSPETLQVDPDDYLIELVSAMTGGIRLKITPSSSDDNFFHAVTDEQTSRYCNKVVSMARGNDVMGLENVLETNGPDALDCYNRFGEGLLTLACRRGFKDMVKFLLSPPVNLTVRVRDDYGRTVVHDACWNPEPQLEICSWLLKREPKLFLLADKRGFSPFQYARKSDWAVWRKFLFDHKEHLLVLAQSSISTVG